MKAVVIAELISILLSVGALPFIARVPRPKVGDEPTPIRIISFAYMVLVCLSYLIQMKLQMMAGSFYWASIICAAIWFLQVIWRNPWKHHLWTMKGE